MVALLLLALVGYAAGLFLSPCFPAKPRVQNRLAHGLAGFAGGGGILLGIADLLTSVPLTHSLPSIFPFLPWQSGLTLTPPFSC
jgi:hypothetical protein